MGEDPPVHRQISENLRDVGQEPPGEEALEHGAEVLERKIESIAERAGGPVRIRIVALLASVLALSAADTGAIAAVAPKLETSLHIGNVQIGLLVTVSALAAATGMLPVGWMTDRAKRTRMVVIAIVAWAVAELLSAISPDYLFLLIVRVALGALTAVTGPTLASLTGDLFPARDRSQIYGYILTGELIGAGLGLVVAGLVSSVATWRPALAVLAIPSILLAWQFHRRLPEPARGGQSRLERGAQEVVAAHAVDDQEDGRTDGPRGGGPSRASAPAPPAGEPDTGSTRSREDVSEISREVRQHRIDPREGVVLERDPLDLGWWEAFRYVVAVRSNLTLILGSALGYFFFGGVETFALIYLEGHYRIGQAPAILMALGVGAAAILGAIVGGRTTDALLRRGHLDARFVVPAASFVFAIVAFVPAVVSTTLFVSIPLFLVAGFCIGGPNPGLDAARLDVMPSRMWGRGEAVRSFLRSILQAFAPLVFGLVSSFFGTRSVGFGVSGSGSGTHVKNAAAHAAGLEQTFVIMLVALVAAAVIVWLGRHSYPHDVAAAEETERRHPPARDARTSSEKEGQPTSGPG